MAKKLPAGWRETFCTLIAEGYTLSDAAAATSVAGGTVRRHLHEDTVFRTLYDEARETVRDKVRNRIWQMAMHPDEVDATTTRWALDHLVKWNLPEARPAPVNALEEGGSDDIAEAIDRFTAAVVSLAARKRAELPAGPAE